MRDESPLHRKTQHGDGLTTARTGWVHRTRREGTPTPSARGARPTSLQILALALLSTALCSACNPGSMSDAAIPASCAQIGAQCQRPEGPIGVCQETHCAAGAQPPCFTCTSQH